MECVWSFCGVGAERVKYESPKHKQLDYKQQDWNLFLLRWTKFHYVDYVYSIKPLKWKWNQTLKKSHLL